MSIANSGCGLLLLQKLKASRTAAADLASRPSWGLRSDSVLISNIIILLIVFCHSEAWASLETKPQPFTTVGQSQSLSWFEVAVAAYIQIYCSSTTLIVHCTYLK